MVRARKQTRVWSGNKEQGHETKQKRGVEGKHGDGDGDVRIHCIMPLCATLTIFRLSFH